MTAFGLILFGLFTGTFLSVLVGMLGRRRQIGFTLTFLVSLIFTPVVGLVVALLSKERPAGDVDNGCGVKVISTCGLTSFLLILLAAILIAAFIAF